MAAGKITKTEWVLLGLTAVFLCGFCVWGAGLLALLFAARGTFLGYCAASVAAANGAAGLVQYFRGRHLVVVNKGQVGSNVGADLTIDGPIGQTWQHSFCACGWRDGRYAWHGSCSVLCRDAPRGKHPEPCGG